MLQEESKFIITGVMTDQRIVRYFTPWQRPKQYEDFLLPMELQELTGQRYIKIGDVVLQANDTSIASEMCEELFTPDCPSIHLGLNGVEIICNSSASHWELRKLSRRLELIKESSKKGGSVYLYSNQQGCDGSGREYYDGCALIIVNGEIKAQASQFSLNDVEVISATVDLDDVEDARVYKARSMQASKEQAYPRVDLDVSLTDRSPLPARKISPNRDAIIVTPQEEISLGAGCWLWDYLRRSNQAGAFLPLSGGVDSGATAVIFYSAVRLVFAACEAGNKQVIKDMRRVCGEKEDSTWLPSEPKELCNVILHTCYMGMFITKSTSFQSVSSMSCKTCLGNERYLFASPRRWPLIAHAEFKIAVGTSNSSKETRARAKALANDIGSYHIDLNMDTIASAFTSLFTSIFPIKKLRFKSEGGSSQENLALQNIQSRSRMVLSYLLASTLTWVRDRRNGGNLLVLGSANVDECLRGTHMSSRLSLFHITS